MHIRCADTIILVSAKQNVFDLGVAPHHSFGKHAFADYTPYANALQTLIYQNRRLQTLINRCLNLCRPILALKVCWGEMEDGMALVQPFKE